MNVENKSILQHFLLLNFKFSRFSRIFFIYLFLSYKKKNVLRRGRIIDFFHRFNSKRNKSFQNFEEEGEMYNPISMTLQSFMGKISDT